MGYSHLIGVAIAGAVATLYTMAGAERSRDAQDVQFDAQVADDLSAAADALSTFLTQRQAYYSTAFNLEAGGIGTIDWPTITAAIPDAPQATNRLGQTLSVLLIGKTGYDMDGNGVACQSDANEPCPIDAYVVTSGGSTVNDARLAAIANRVTQGRGGGVYDVMGIINSATPHDYAGAMHWTVSRAQFGPYAFPTPGHPLAHTVIGGATSDISAPSRYPHPTRNKWHANQDFAGCDDPSTPATTETTAGCKITGAGDVTLATGQSLARGVMDIIPATDGDVITKPNCATGLTPSGYPALERAVLNNQGTPIHGVRTWLEDTSQTTWTVRLRFITENSLLNNPLGEAPAGPDFGRVLVSLKCS